MKYQDLVGINWSSLKAMTVSPKHYKYRLTRKTPDSPAMRFGRAVHTMVLEPEHFEKRHPTFPGAARRGKKWDEFQLDHPGADPLIASEAERVTEMCESAIAHPEVRRHLTSTTTEVTLEWEHPETGLPCKGRCDAVGKILVELKTCNSKDFAPPRFQYHSLRMDYHGQMAFYQDGLEEMGMMPEGQPVMIVLESEPPYDVAIYRPEIEWIQAGRERYEGLLRQVAACSKLNDWPGVCPGLELQLGLPQKRGE